MTSEDKKLQEIMQLTEQRTKAMQGMIKADKKFKDREKKLFEESRNKND